MHRALGSQFTNRSDCFDMSEGDARKAGDDYALPTPYDDSNGIA